MKLSNRVFSLLLVLAGAASLFAQESASVVGTVSDSSGAPMAGVSVSIRNTGTNATVTAVTANDGNFSSPPLPPGSYSVSAEAQGFSKTIQNVTLQVDQHSRIDFSLKPGAVNESVTVEANAAILETQSAEIGNVRTSQAVNDLPINGRDFFCLDVSCARREQFGNGVHDVARRQQSIGTARRFGKRDP
jgi:hypothetical protein